MPEKRILLVEDFQQFVAAVAQIGLYWLVLDEPPPPTVAA